MIPLTITTKCFKSVIVMVTGFKWLVFSLYFDVEQFFTRTPWWVIPSVWLPVVCWFISSSVKFGLPAYHVEAAVVGGIFLWTFIEYTLHRFLFHMKTTTYWYVFILLFSPQLISNNQEIYADNLVNCTQGKYTSLPSSWLPSQAPHGQPPTRFSSCSSSNFIHSSMKNLQ